SNCRHRGFQPRALPTELPRRGDAGPSSSPAGLTGFEPATSTLTGWRARPSCSTGPSFIRAPNGVRTRVSALKGRYPGPLDDGGGCSVPAHRSSRPGGSLRSIAAEVRAQLLHEDVTSSDLGVRGA